MHLSEINLKNFKIFDEIQLQGLGQINILLGDNNIGKTTLLHGLLFDEEPQVTLFNFFNTLVWKYNIVQLFITTHSVECLMNLTKAILDMEVNSFSLKKQFVILYLKIK